MPTGARIRLCLLGGFSVELAGTPVRSLRISSRKGRALLAYLAMQPEQRASREQLADLLWGDRFDAQARHSLRQCLVSLRRDLEPAGVSVLPFDEGSVGLGAGQVATDALEFSSLAASGEPADRARAMEVYAGQFLLGFSLDAEPFDSWVRAERARLAALAVGGFSDAAARWEATGDGTRAIAAAERLVKLDGLREDSQRLLLRLYARYRGRDAALAHAKTVAALLRAELDADPEPATRALIDDVRRGAIARAAQPTATAAPVAEFAAISAPEEATQVVGSDVPDVTCSVNADVAATAENVPVSRPGIWGWRERAAPKAIAAYASLALVVASAAGMWLGPDATTAVRPAGDRLAHAPAPAVQSWQSPSILPGVAADKEALGDKGLYAIAVLPFSAEAGEGSPEQKLADGLADDLVNDLSRIPTLRVIARQTTRLYRGKTIDVAAVGAELGVHYVVEGSMRMQDARVRINVALIDAKNRVQVWSDRFERSEAERFAVQDEIARGLARRLQLGMVFDRGARAERRGSSDPGVEELLAKGWSIVFRNHTAGNAKGADRLFQQTLERQPDNVSAMIGLAAYHIATVTNLEVVTREPSLGIAQALLERVIAKRPHVSTAHHFHGLLLRLRGELQPALEAFTRAIELNPSLATAYAGAGHVLSRLGRPQEALEQIRYAMRLSPKDPQLGVWSVYAGLSELGLGREDAALEWLARAAALSPRTPFVYAALASAHALKGDPVAAARHVAELKRLAPLFDEAALLEWFVGPGGEQGHASRFIEGLRLALKQPS